VAQDRLTRVVAIVAVLGFGAAAEALGGADLEFADFAVGVAIGCGGALLLGRATRPALLALATSVAWFLGSLDGAGTHALDALGAVLLLAYRGPLLHLLLGVPAGRVSSRRGQALAAGAWVCAVLPLEAARPATTIAAALVATDTAVRARRAGADRRPALDAAAAAAAALAVVWALGWFEVFSATVLLVVTDIAVLAAGAVALAAAGGVWARSGARALVVDLGPTRRPGQPLTSQLARALGDPELDLRYEVPGLGWVDEVGHPTPDPGVGPRVTRASAPGGGEVALISGDGVPADPRLVKAAASAAALALDAARLDAETRARAVEVRASRRRILGVGDAERRSLEQRLNERVLTRLRSAERLLGPGNSGADTDRAELRAAMAELTALSRGLYPPTLARSDLRGALAEIAQRSPVRTAVEFDGDLSALPEPHAAAVWFICSEALANIARHADASEAALVVRADRQTIDVEVRDDGVGGATLTRGLRGLADRVDALGGRLTLDSPPGGPTLVSARLPL